MKINYKVILVLFFNVFLVILLGFILFCGNKIGNFLKVSSEEIDHCYIPDNVIYIQGGSLSLNEIMSLENNENSSAVYFAGYDFNESKTDKNRDLFLNIANNFYVPIESKIDDLAIEGYEIKKKKYLNESTEKDLLEEKFLIKAQDYEFKIPVSGKYDILLQQESALNKDNETKFLFDNEVVEKNMVQINEEWVLWNKVYFNSGPHSFSVVDSSFNIKFIKSSEVILRIAEPSNLLSYSLKFAKINSTKYVVKLEELTEQPFLLVFLEGFHKDWKIYLADESDRYDFWQTWLKKPIFAENHFLTNGFANGWWVDPTNLPNLANKVFIIEYLPQKSFYLGLFIAFLTLLFCFNYIFLKS